VATAVPMTAAFKLESAFAPRHLCAPGTFKGLPITFVSLVCPYDLSDPLHIESFVALCSLVIRLLTVVVVFRTINAQWIGFSTPRPHCTASDGSTV